jgi:hypothetical protein
MVMGLLLCRKRAGESKQKALRLGKSQVQGQDSHARVNLYTS